MIRVVKPPDERRAEFISSAQQLFYTKGYENTSVNDIIKAVGVSKGAFYHYFDAKEAILAAVVDQLIEQTLGLTEAIVADPDLDAISKFNRLRQVISNWKIERKTEMLAIARIIMLPANLPLYHRMRSEGEKVYAAQFAKIIEQGIAEAVFQTNYPAASARHFLAIMRTASEQFLELLFHPEDHPDPITAAQANFNAAQAAIERLLAAPSGSLSFIDAETVAAWFEEE